VAAGLLDLFLDGECSLGSNAAHSLSNGWAALCCSCWSGNLCARGCFAGFFSFDAEGGDGEAGWEDPGFVFGVPGAAERPDSCAVGVGLASRELDHSVAKCGHDESIVRHFLRVLFPMMLVYSVWENGFRHRNLGVGHHRVACSLCSEHYLLY